MSGREHANGFAGEDQPRVGGDEAPAVRDAAPSGPQAKTTQHQVREIHRLVDNAMESLEQVVRALRYLERDL